MNTKDKIAVMQAYLDGKEIEFKTPDDPDWRKHEIEPQWDWSNNDYRIKPKFGPPKELSLQFDAHGNISHESSSGYKYVLVEEEKWENWYGGPCPVSGDIRVRIKCRNGSSTEGNAGDFSWFNSGSGNSIIAYLVIE